VQAVIDTVRALSFTSTELLSARPRDLADRW
jgi:hypothetical protein